MPGSFINNMPPQDDDMQRRIRDIQRQAREDAASVRASFQGMLDDLRNQLIELFEDTYYTQVETDSQIATAVASPGDIAPEDVTASGQVSSALPFKSAGTFGYLVANNYQSVWQDGDTFQLGYSPSSTVVKTALTPITAADVQELLGLTAYWGRYIWDAEDVPPRVFLLAADVQAAGFGPDVAPVVTGDDPLIMIGTDGKPILDADGNQCTVPAGEAYTINYSQLVVPLLATAKAQQAEIAALGARLDAAGIA
jgi:hypothetical protein